MNWENKKNNITGRSRLFVTPITIQWWTVIKVDDYWLKEPIKRQNHFWSCLKSNFHYRLCVYL